jgi:predicted transglutaminase-like cysteine proteinase
VKFAKVLRVGTAAVVLCLGASVIGTAHAAAKAKAVPSIFGTVEVRKTNLAPFPKWTDALERFKQERTDNRGPCKSSPERACHYKVWAKFINGAKDLDAKAQLQAVNDFMNRARYVVDQINWGVKDYWETPGQFFAKFGDCEDYAIAKYMSLRALGFEAAQMRIVVLQDLNLKVGHAVLAVEMDGQTWILDNQIKTVIEAGRIRHYRPVYSVNERAWWLHRKI